MDETVSDEEIYQSVMDMCKAEQMIEVNGGYDSDSDAVEQKPTCKEAFTATFTLRSYIADINEPFACKFGRHSCEFWMTNPFGGNSVVGTNLYHRLFHS